MKKMIILFAIIAICSGCTAIRPYKITFTNGYVEFYELDYKPKKGAKSIEYRGETIFGVESIEIVK
jgi:uncharacterized protein YceK